MFKETFRTLKPGGKLTISDMVLLRELPDAIKNSIDSYIGCVSGAMMKDEYIKTIKSAGFKEVTILDETHFPAEYLVNDPTVNAIIENLKLSREKLFEIAQSVVSIKVYGFKPEA